MDRAKSMVRIGKVTSLNLSKTAARVLFEENGLVSNELQIIQTTSIKENFYYPKVGERVACVFLPTGAADGFIIGSIQGGE